MTKLQYNYQEWPDGETCHRCGETIHSGWWINNHKYGPTCGPIVLKKAGVTWAKKFGPGSFDPVAMKEAVALAYEVKQAKRNRQPYDYQAVQAMKKVVGTVGYKIAQYVALKDKSGHSLLLSSQDAIECYEAAVLEIL